MSFATIAPSVPISRKSPSHDFLRPDLRPVSPRAAIDNTAETPAILRPVLKPVTVVSPEITQEAAPAFSLGASKWKRSSFVSAEDAGAPAVPVSIFFFINNACLVYN
jgi:hypothetical protein